MTSKILATLFFILIAGISKGQLWISEVQGSGTRSPFVGEQITLDTCQVTAAGSGLFFVVSLPEKRDFDKKSSEGLWIMFGQSRNLKIGDLIVAEGLVAEDGNNNTILISSRVDVVGTKALPIPLALDSLTSLRNRDSLTYENLEGVWVSMNSGYVVQPADRGQEISVNPLGQRSFREPGLSYPVQIPGLPQFDENPEILSIEPGRFMAANDESVLAGSRAILTGVIVQKQNTYALWPVTLIMEPPNLSATLPKDRTDILSVASLNVRQFGTLEPGFDARVQKLANYLREEAGYPDIIAFQEIKNLAALEILSDIIGQTPEGVTYIPFIETGSGNSDIHNAYLYKPCFSKLFFKRMGVFESLSLGGRLHDRPPLLMEFVSPHDSMGSFRILNVHLRSLIGIDGTNGNFVRRKRHEQAVSIAHMIDQFPKEDPLLIVGDFNAFPFSDGYVDVFAQISGKESLGALLPPERILSDSLESPLLELPHQEQYSYIFNGYSQLIDHLLSRNSDLFNTTSYHMLRGNTDVPSSWESDPSKKWRFSDHDGFLVHYYLPEAQRCEPVTEIVEKFEIQYPNPQTEGDLRLTISSPKQDWVMLELYDLSGKQVKNAQFKVEEGSQEIVLDGSVPAGMYLLRVQVENKTFTGKWVTY